MRMRCIFLVRAMLFVGIPLSARAQSDSPKPAPELKKLDYFVGTWSAEGEIKPGPFGAGGKFTGINLVRWIDNGFFLVTQSEFNGALGEGTETAYMGYDSSEKIYTYDSFHSLGEADHAKGNVDGDTWTWLSETSVLPTALKGRLTLQFLSARRWGPSFALHADGRKSSDDRPLCLENPRPAGAEPTLTENLASPFQTEPRHVS